MTLKLFPSEKRSHHRKLFTIIGTWLASVSAGSYMQDQHCPDRLHVLNDHISDTPKAINSLHNKILNKCRNYDFKYVSICDHLCSVHRKKFLTKDVSVSNYAQLILLRSHNLGKRCPGATAIFVGESQFSQTPIFPGFCLFPCAIVNSTHCKTLG